MKNFVAFSIIFVLLHLHRADSGSILCSGTKSIMKLTPDLLLKINRSSYWTTFYIGSPEPINFPSPSRLARTDFILKSVDDSWMLCSTTLIPILDLHSNDKPMIQTKYFNVDDEEAIFEIDGRYEEIEATNIEGDYTASRQANNLTSPYFKFALIYADKNHNFRIFQVCEGTYAWVHIRDNFSDPEQGSDLKMDDVFNPSIKKAIERLELRGNLKPTFPLTGTYTKFNHWFKDNSES